MVREGQPNIIKSAFNSDQTSARQQISIYLVKLLKYVGWQEAQVVRFRILLERTPFGDI